MTCCGATNLKWTKIFMTNHNSDYLKFKECTSCGHKVDGDNVKISTQSNPYERWTTIEGFSEWPELSHTKIEEIRHQDILENSGLGKIHTGTNPVTLSSRQRRFDSMTIHEELGDAYGDVTSDEFYTWCRQLRPEPWEPLELSEATQMLQNEGCVWLMNYTENEESPDYPIECEDELLDVVEWARTGEGVTLYLLDDHRHPDTVSFDMRHPRAVDCLEWRRFSRAISAPFGGEEE